MKKNNGLGKIKGRKSLMFPIIFGILSTIITIYLILKVSFVLNKCNTDYVSFFPTLWEHILKPLPLEFTFHPYSLCVFSIHLVIWAWVLKQNAMPKSDSKWLGKEHGSNDFYTPAEMKDFIRQKTDPIIPFKQEEIDRILNYKG